MHGPILLEQARDTRHERMALRVRSALATVSALARGGGAAAGAGGRGRGLDGHARSYLERGRWADLIVLGKNPLEDIRNTRTIEMVMIAGNKI